MTDTKALLEALDAFTQRFAAIRVGGPTADGRSHFQGSLSSDQMAGYEVVVEAARNWLNHCIDRDQQAFEREVTKLLRYYLRDEVADRVIYQVISTTEPHERAEKLESIRESFNWSALG